MLCNICGICGAICGAQDGPTTAPERHQGPTQRPPRDAKTAPKTPQEASQWSPKRSKSPKSR
eukprot:8294081-Pyramimonas_sp.AAC.1